MSLPSVALVDIISEDSDENGRDNEEFGEHGNGVEFM
jgi:hypothetical protein